MRTNFWKFSPSALRKKSDFLVQKGQIFSHFAFSFIRFAKQSTFSFLFSLFSFHRKRQFSEKSEEWREKKEKNTKKKRQLSSENCRFFLVIHRRVELRTPWLKVMCSTYWANGSYSIFVAHPWALIYDIISYSVCQ